MISHAVDYCPADWSYDLREIAPFERSELCSFNKQNVERLRETFDLNFLRERPLEILPTRSSPTIFRTFPSRNLMVPSGRSRLLLLHPMYPWHGGGKRKTTRMTMTAASLRGSLRQRAVQRRMDPRTIRKSSLKPRFSRVGISLLVSPKIIFTSERTSEDSSVRALTKCSPCIYKTMF
ncbi:uncharacterized protein [Mycetomoellerius zeteki]|uniref:uncharacterized protein n=1 Tax=Mycetomoellerius zeteki TaxID=64791 RepID=UPI00084E80EF|nr:PREDICTED: uncharacterized protein LOC108722868 [Trachymyrmex zeteki]